MGDRNPTTCKMRYLVIFLAATAIVADATLNRDDDSCDISGRTALKTSTNFEDKKERAGCFLLNDEVAPNYRADNKIPSDFKCEDYYAVQLRDNSDSNTGVKSGTAWKCFTKKDGRCGGKAVTVSYEKAYDGGEHCTDGYYKKYRLSSDSAVAKYKDVFAWPAGTTPSVSSCQDLCAQDADCKAISFKSADRDCSMYNTGPCTAWKGAVGYESYNLKCTARTGEGEMDLDILDGILTPTWPRSPLTSELENPQYVDVNRP